jgi:GGDEF domain-containing protein
LEAVTRQVALAFKRTVDPMPVQKDQVGGIPRVLELDKLICEGRSYTPISTVLVVNVLNIAQVAAIHGQVAADIAIQHVAKHLQRSLHMNDMLFRHDNDQLVALLNRIDDAAISSIGEQLALNLRNDPVQLITGDSLVLRCVVATILLPADQQQLEQALQAVRSVNVAESDNSSRSVIH